jgi:hypothetical protein
MVNRLRSIGSNGHVRLNSPRFTVYELDRDEQDGRDRSFPWRWVGKFLLVVAFVVVVVAGGKAGFDKYAKAHAGETAISARKEIERTAAEADASGKALLESAGKVDRLVSRARGRFSDEEENRWVALREHLLLVREAGNSLVQSKQKFDADMETWRDALRAGPTVFRRLKEVYESYAEDEPDPTVEKDYRHMAAACSATVKDYQRAYDALGGRMGEMHSQFQFILRSLEWVERAIEFVDACALGTRELESWVKRTEEYASAFRSSVDAFRSLTSEMTERVSKPSETTNRRDASGKVAPQTRQGVEFPRRDQEVRPEPSDRHVEGSRRKGSEEMKEGEQRGNNEVSVGTSSLDLLSVAFVYNPNAEFPGNAGKSALLVRGGR